MRIKEELITKFKILVYNMGRPKTEVLNELCNYYKGEGYRETDIRAIFRTGTRWNY